MDNEVLDKMGELSRQRTEGRHRSFPTRWTMDSASVICLLIILMGVVHVRSSPLSTLPRNMDASQQDKHIKQQQLFALLRARPATLNEGLDRREQEQEEAIIKPPGVNKYTDMGKLSFLGDDGGRYEKAATDLMSKTFLLSESGGNRAGSGFDLLLGVKQGLDCPKECKCLNDYFICNRKQLSYVPALPGYVQSVDFNGNKLNDSTVLQITNLLLLNKLILRRNQLQTIPEFHGLPSLKHLNLAGNRIEIISSSALAALPKLKILDLSRNNLHTIKANHFPSNNQLNQLLLNGNRITLIEENAFVSLTHLHDLELNSNRLTILPTGVFQNLAKLRKLSLNNNRLEVNWSTFRGLQSLQKLHLQSNNIRTLQDGVFHVMRQIETIELDHNRITSLNRQGLFNLTKLHHLSLSNNSIASIEPDTWEFTQSLVTLDLSSNNITELQPQHFDCLQRLRQLNLAENNIQYLHENTFDCVKNLEDLSLRHNLLSAIIEDLGVQPPFKALRKLKKLDLFGNGLKQINTRTLAGLNNLEWLNLGGNDIATIQSGSFGHMVHLQKLSLRSSNLICNCELLWFREWLIQYYQKIEKNPGDSQLVCGFPATVQYVAIRDLDPESMVCGEAPRPSLVQEPENQLTVKGANISLKCLASTLLNVDLHSTDDEIQISWTHNNRRVYEMLPSSSSSTGAFIETQIFHDKPTNLTFARGHLLLYNVNYSSAGKYQCVVSNRFGTTYSERSKVSIGIRPTFSQVPSDVIVDSGETVRLLCSAIGDPQPEIALQKFGSGDFPAAIERRLQVIREENAFLITNAKPSDSGIYTCTADSPAGEIKVNASLLVNDKPQPNVPIIHKEIVVGKSSVLECLIDTNAGLDMTQLNREWYKDNKPFHITPALDADRYYYTAERELLIIVNTQSVDAGGYRCELSDDSNLRFAIHIDLLVVQEHFNSGMIVLGAALVTFACIFIGSLIIWIILQCHKRKLHATGIRRSVVGVNGGVIMSTLNARVAATTDDNAIHAFTANQNAAISDTACHTYLAKRNRHHECLFLAQRPRSLAALELSELRHCQGEDYLNEYKHEPRRSCLIVNNAHYEQLMMLPRSKADNGQEGLLRGDDNSHLGRTYWRRNNMLPADLYHQQDHLSSKDSGTESDAAVKRSLEDVTLPILMNYPSNGGSPPLAVVHLPNEEGRRLALSDWNLQSEGLLDDSKNSPSSVLDKGKNSVPFNEDKMVGLIINHPDEGGGSGNRGPQTLLPAATACSV